MMRLELGDVMIEFECEVSQVLWDMLLVGVRLPSQETYGVGI